MLKQIGIFENLSICNHNTQTRSPKNCFSSEWFIWLQKLTNLRIKEAGKQRSISEAERALLIEEPLIKSKLTYKQVRNLLNLSTSCRFNGLNYWEEKKKGDELKAENKTLFEATFFHKLRKCYADSGLSLFWDRDRSDCTRLDDIGYALSVFKSDSEIESYLKGQGLEQAIIESILNISFSGFLHLSTSAIKQLNPLLEKGFGYSDAVSLLGFSNNKLQKNKGASLPRLSRNEIMNPVVSEPRALKL